MKHFSNNILKLAFGALLVSSFAACSLAPEPVVLDNGDAIVASDGSSQKIPGLTVGGDPATLQPGEVPDKKWGFPEGFPAACASSANIVKNPRFMLGVVGSSNMPPASVADWQNAGGTPQSSCGLVMGHNNPVYMQMWGFKDGGEAVRQASVPFAANSQYDVYLSAMQFNETTSVTPLRLRLIASAGVTNPWTFSGPAGQLIDTPISPSTSNYQTTWKKFGAFTLTTGATAPDTLTLASSNTVPYAEAQPATVSWGRYDNVCILPKAKVDLAINKQLSATTLTAGGVGTYSLTVVNPGGAVPSGIVQVGDNLPAGLTLQTPYPSSPNWNCGLSTPAQLVCTYVGAYPLPSGFSDTINFNVFVSGNLLGGVKNCANLYLAYGALNDSDLSNNLSCITNIVKPRKIIDSESLNTALTDARTQLETYLETSTTPEIALERATYGLKDTLKTQVRLAAGASLESVSGADNLFQLTDTLTGESLSISINCTISSPPIKVSCTFSFADNISKSALNTLSDVKAQFEQMLESSATPEEAVNNARSSNGVWYTNRMQNSVAVAKGQHIKEANLTARSAEQHLFTLTEDGTTSSTDFSISCTVSYPPLKARCTINLFD